MNVIPLADLAEAPDWLTTSSPRVQSRENLAVGVRPEAIRLADGGLPARVTAIEYLGADSLVEAASGTTRIVVRLPGKAPCAVGESVALNWEHVAAHWFDLSSGRRTP